MTKTIRLCSNRPNTLLDLGALARSIYRVTRESTVIYRPNRPQ
jgi:hypothetical protein